MLKDKIIFRICWAFWLCFCLTPASIWAYLVIQQMHFDAQIDAVRKEINSTNKARK
jgi:hypothetical protein